MIQIQPEAGRSIDQHVLDGPLIAHIAWLLTPAAARELSPSVAPGNRGLYRLTLTIAVETLGDSECDNREHNEREPDDRVTFRASLTHADSSAAPDRPTTSLAMPEVDPAALGLDGRVIVERLPVSPGRDVTRVTVNRSEFLLIASSVSASSDIDTWRSNDSPTHDDTAIARVIFHQTPALTRLKPGGYLQA